MKEYFCHFCQQLTHSFYQEELKNEYGLLLRLCHPCQAEYLYWGNINLASVSLYSYIKDKLYKWSFPTEGQSKLWLVHGTIPSIPGTFTFKGKLIKKFPDPLTGVAPANIRNKIITLLTFL